MVEVLKDLVAAVIGKVIGRHICLLYSTLLIFREFDTTNYLQYESLYLENMHLLPEEH